MSSKTKIVVLHMKEVIYTGIFVVFAIVLAVLLFMMFGKGRKRQRGGHCQRPGRLSCRCLHKSHNLK